MESYVGARIFDGERFHEDFALVVEDGSCRALTSTKDRPSCKTIDLGGGVLAPGFVDWQVNGGGGHLFNDSPTPETIRAIASAHRRFGTTALAPTVVTDAPEVLAAALRAGREPIEGSLGVHAEGPFIDPRRPGVHPPAQIRRMTKSDADILIAEKVRVVTVAPASVTLEQIGRLAKAGVVVSIGHAEATAEEARACFDAGARAVTHLFNAMSQLQSRAPGLVGAALDDARVTVGFIADGLHAHDIAGRLALRLKGPAGLALISDAMPPAAGGPDAFFLQGREARRVAEKLTLANGTLAGAAITMLDAVRHAVRRLGAPLADALAMATMTPARLLGAEAQHGCLRPGARADFIHLGEDLELRGVWFGGMRTATT